MDPMESIKVTFFQECEELLADLETGLLAMQAGVTDSETVNAVFRAVHSVKGGAGAFGMEALVRFAHVFETTLDAVRRGELSPDSAVVSVLLRSADRLADHVAAARAGDSCVADDGELVEALEGLLGAPLPDEDAEPDVVFTPLTLSLGGDEPMAAPLALTLDLPAEAPTSWTIRFTPQAVLYRNGNDPVLLLRELERLGTLSVEVDRSAVPSFDSFDVEASYLSWTIGLEAACSESDIREAFEFVEGQCELVIERNDPWPSAIADEAPGEPGDMPSLADLLALAGAPADEITPLRAAADPDPAPLVPLEPSKAAEVEPAAGRTDAPPKATIRVDLDRVDRLIDLVGELVINQAMLAQKVMEAGASQTESVSLALDDLELLTRDIQDSVMAIRAQPVKSVFQRMPRLVREVAAMTGKSVRLVMDGEGTEVDKTVIERLADPLTHMIRNAIDHGLEDPATRLASGKPEEGLIRLSAQHRSGRIVIEISDDGKGIDRGRVREIAVSRGLIDADAILSEEETDNLIFAPGFSTAATVSDISGRGVGMDVVKRSIQALGGRITITSTPGRGSKFSLSLPLTLAVLDGMVVTVGAQTLVVPISVIVETLRPREGDIRPLGPHGHVLAVRGSHVPVIDVATTLGFAATPAEEPGVSLLVESEFGGLAALNVDGIQGQRQVVIKSLEQNYAQVPGIGAATILGDGRVALIVDVEALISMRRRAPARVAPFALAS
jgi:two-component system chemotaxis sensor kinase CheA